MNDTKFNDDSKDLQNSRNKNFSNLIKIIAMGNVYFEREEEVIKSDLVSFFPKENKVKITGNVKVVKGKNIGFKSEVLEINLKILLRVKNIFCIIKRKVLSVINTVKIKSKTIGQKQGVTEFSVFQIKCLCKLIRSLIKIKNKF